MLLPAAAVLYIGISLLKTHSFKTVDLLTIDLDEGRRVDLDATFVDEDEDELDRINGEFSG